MKENEQNKQSEQQKRKSNLKFLSIKSIIRNKKIVVKKTFETPSLFTKTSNNAFSTCDFGYKTTQIHEGEDHCTQRALSGTKVNTLAVGNVINIKFREEATSLHKHSDNKMRKKFTGSTGNSGYSQDTKKSSFIREKLGMGAVEETLIIQPLQKMESHFGWDRKKGFYNYMLITKKSRKISQNNSIAHETAQEFRNAQKTTEIISKHHNRKSVTKNYRTSTSFMPNCSKIRQTCQNEKIHHQIRQRNSAMNIQQEKAQKIKQKQLNEIILKQYRDILPLRKPANRKDYFVFSMSDKTSEPQNRIQMYRDYLWKVNYSNGLFVYTPDNIQVSYKAYIGPGNNSCMLKSILRRRSWWTIVESSAQNECNFVWTQLKINSLFKGQQNRNQNLKTDEYYHGICSENVEDRGFQSQEEQLNFYAHGKIFNKNDLINWDNHMKKNSKSQQKITQQTHIKRLKLYTKKHLTKFMDSQQFKIYNHLQYNYFLGNKKALFYNIKRICQLRGQSPFNYVPLTFHISKGVEDPIYEQFLQSYKMFEDMKKVDKNCKNIWICKPGQNTNRGNGISVCSGLDDVRHRLRGKQKNGDGKPRTFILQKYIEKPFLYKNRKFDIRHYILLNCFNGNFKAYWFEEGYVRTSSSVFSLKNSHDLMVHLTNDAVQKKADSYGKHEKGNKVSYEDFQKYLDGNYKKKYNFIGKTLQKMKMIARTAVQATYFLLDPNRKEHNFELIGLDFMIDQNFKPWLIEANTNPCLELSSPLLQKLIPSVIEQTFRMCVDPFFPPPENCSIKNKFYGENALLENKFQLIFDETVDGEKIRKLLKQNEQNGGIFNDLIGKIQEDNELFEDDGNQNWEQKNTI